MNRPLRDHDAAELRALEQNLAARFDTVRASGLRLDLTRGKPAVDQLDLSNALDGVLQGGYAAEDGTDVRNYGGLRGIPEARALGARLLDVDPGRVIAGGNSSLWMMYLTVDSAMNSGLVQPAWRAAGRRPKALCPVPGYDRHFTLTESLGIDMINVAMLETGPDMDAVERLVETDADVKFIWCVPKYQNPTGCTYTPETVRRLAELPKRAASDFLVLWDNAYAVHDFEFPATPVDNLYDHAVEAGTADSVVLFASTSKITFAGAGVAFLAGSDAMLEAIEARLNVMMVGPDKVNQLRHARWLDGRLEAHMRAHAALVKPKFDAVQEGLTKALDGLDVATWTQPRGGYFVSLDTQPGLASEVVAMAKAAGVTLTPAGAPFPYGKDPEDRNVRIAPTFATLAEVVAAIDVVGLCVKLASVRRLLKDK